MSKLDRPSKRSARRMAGGILFTAFLFLPAVATAQTIAITGATVFPVSGPRIEDATVLIEDGIITAVGRNVSVPSGARRVDGRGMWVTPGLINAATQVGLVEIGSATGTAEGSRGLDVAASFNVLEGINPASQLIPNNRIAGVTTVVSAPSGGLIAGQAVAIDLAGNRVEEMVIRSPVAMLAAINEGAKSTGGGSRAGVMARLRQILDAALAHSNGAGGDAGGDRPAPASDLESLVPVVRG